MAKKGKLRPDRSGRDVVYRAGFVTDGEVREEDRSIPLVLATENEVAVFDPVRRAVVGEVLRVDGIDVPDRVPMCDSHDRTTVRTVLGSMRDFQKTDGKLIARAYFARDDDAQRAFDNYRDGHLTDFSVFASVQDVVRDDAGNRDVVRSKLVEGSAVVAGHDPDAKALTPAMRAYVDPQAMKDEAMNDAMKAALVAKGLPETATDDEAVAFLDTLTVTDSIDDTATVVASTEPIEEDSPAESGAADMATETVDTAELVSAERKRITTIDDICRRVGADEAVRRSLIDDPNMTAEQAALDLIRRDNPAGAKATGPARIESGTSEREKWYGVVHAAVIQRAAQTADANPAKFLDHVERIEKGSCGLPVKYQDRDAVQRNQRLQKEMTDPDPAVDEFRYVDLPGIARMMMERSGQRVDGLPKHEIVRRALSQPMFVERASDGPATNTTGSFTNLLLDASNKTLLAGYDEAEHTYSMWVRQAPSAPDFKTLNRIRFGEMADPEEVPENHEYPEKGTQDAKESYNVSKKGEIFSISFEAVVNDDLNAIIRIPQMQGFAMRRKINKDAYAILTANADLSDGVALFHATSHGANLDATALSEAALDTGFNVMATQTGLSGDGTPLGLKPTYLIVPFALGATATRLVTGGVVPVSSGSTVPLYGDGRPRPIAVVEEAQLDANSTTGWYLAANSGAVETVEVTFLQGEESPVLSREEGFTSDNMKYKIRQTYAFKAIDYRGLYQGNS